MVRLLILFVIALASCKGEKATNTEVAANVAVQLQQDKDNTDVEPKAPYDPASKTINTGNTKPAELIAFAKSLIGTPYLYGSTDPANGFDCSGFITYVFNHFNIAVPRSSIDFTNVHREVPLDSALPGDLILFTGTDSTAPEVGHMGIIVTAGEQKEFIHSTSGKAKGVTITPVSDYYLSRFVKVVRAFE